MKWMSSCELLCLTVKLQSSKRIFDFLVGKDFCCCSELKREGVKIVSQTENVAREITVHVSFQFLVVD